jgi:DUF4097 and DUF4098 domain-containing protein YvlB
MASRVAPVLAAIVPIIGLCSCTFAGPRIERDVKMSVDHVAGKPIKIISSNGGIEVRKADVAAVEVEVVLAGPAKDRLDKAQVTSERAADGELRLGVVWPGGKPENNEGATFKVRLPDAAGVTADTSNGAIEIAGLTGKAMLDTSNGAVTVRDHAGPVVIDTSNAGVNLANLAGEVRVDTSNGSITARDIGAPAKLETSNGGITAEFAMDATGPVTLDTSNGNIKVTFFASYAATIAMETSNGRITVDAPPGASKVSMSKDQDHGTLVLGAGGPSSKFETSNGSINVHVKAP